MSGRGKTLCEVLAAEKAGAPERIVAEMTRSWGFQDDGARPLLSQEFERCIAANAARGYGLESWQLQQVAFPRDRQRAPIMTETIVAVFKRL